MKKLETGFLVCLIVLAGSLSMVGCGSPPKVEKGVLEIWATWGDEAKQLQAFLDRFSQSTGIPVRVTTRLGSDDLSKMLAGAAQPDLVLLSDADLVAAYSQAGAGLTSWGCQVIVWENPSSAK